MSKLSLFCNICKNESSMIEETIPKFSRIIRMFGKLIAIAAVLGLLIAIIMFLSSISEENKFTETKQYNSEAAGAVIIAELDLGYSLFFGFISLLGGLTSWILHMKTKVYKCLKCDHVFRKSDIALEIKQDSR